MNQAVATADKHACPVEKSSAPATAVEPPPASPAGESPPVDHFVSCESSGGSYGDWAPSVDALVAIRPFSYFTKAKDEMYLRACAKKLGTTLMELTFDGVHSSSVAITSAAIGGRRFAGVWIAVGSNGSLGFGVIIYELVGGRLKPYFQDSELADAACAYGRGAELDPRVPGEWASFPEEARRVLCRKQ
jgi:hypothetical protein